jgi:2-hydroxy-4-carboxymuconate semialdehyde hemiacetal dehydrogenase
MPLNLALLGYGSIARFHVQAFREIPDADVALYGVMGPRPESTEAFARELGFARATTDLDELLADPAVDAVVITSPSEAHAEQTAAALRAGKHVLCEIPLAMSLPDVDRLIRLAEQADRTLMVCHTERFEAGLMEARRRVAEGELHPTAAFSRYMFHRRENVNWMGRRRTWTDNLLWHHGCHAVDALLWLLGADDADVKAQVAAPSGPLDIPMDLAVGLRTPANQVASVAMSYNTHLPFHDYLLIGQETTLLYDSGTLYDRDRVVVQKGGEASFEAAVRRQNAEFLAALRERREPESSAASVLPTMALLDRIDKAMQR